MNSLFYVLISVVVLYVLILLLRRISWFNVCALCGSVSATWIVFLALYYTGVRTDPVLIGILMGGSVVGLIELVSKKVPESFQIFKIALYLTFIVIAYGLLQRYISEEVFGFLAALWAMSVFIYMFQHNERIKAVGRHIIECCKNW
ncbi:MAG: hypothetical protein COV34_02905 [Candidatus Zambryskibacteria bacterium CG10_big_fil_rev_8_21_14_0_10_42_12]|uniref:Uncharacterized protein n=1 Tax=Candidatus Zambryskibacteria bacterium CG10_big_fil_rev_8_21_14_0_10_42_12 TaxID=1975115 RepID=A0A2H0QUR5_9BACT|nr:MAG: hypothetical protein COV34_02905 [Candidatus Zambryskibacteria bacterium CG10_big_fil_rev_8_21_14_0_10_42_12]